MQNEKKYGFSIYDFLLVIRHYREVIPFIRKHRLWDGLQHYGWAILLLLAGSVLVSLKLLGIVWDWWSETGVTGMTLSSVGRLFNHFASEGYDLFVMGGFKYILLILLEVVIFHFARKTLEILTGEASDATLQAFIRAQIRMIQVVIYSFIMETVFSVGGGIVLGIIGLDWFKSIFTVAIQCYFLGFAVIDNFNEIYHLSIKQSARYTQLYIGAALGVGLVVYILMLFPLVGTLLAPLLGAVVATRVMYEIEQRDHRIHAFVLASQKPVKEAH